MIQQLKNWMKEQNQNTQHIDYEAIVLAKFTAIGLSIMGTVSIYLSKNEESFSGYMITGLSIILILAGIIIIAIVTRREIKGLDYYDLTFFILKSTIIDMIVVLSITLVIIIILLFGYITQLII